MLYTRTLMANEKVTWNTWTTRPLDFSSALVYTPKISHSHLLGYQIVISPEEEGQYGQRWSLYSLCILLAFSHGPVISAKNA